MMSRFLQVLVKVIVTGDTTEAFGETHVSEDTCREKEGGRVSPTL